MQMSLKIEAAPSHAAIVQLEHQKSLLGQVLGSQVNRQSPGVKHRLRMWPAVHGHKQRTGTVTFRSVQRPVQGAYRRRP